MSIKYPSCSGDKRDLEQKPIFDACRNSEIICWTSSQQCGSSARDQCVQSCCLPKGVKTRQRFSAQASGTESTVKLLTFLPELVSPNIVRIQCNDAMSSGANSLPLIHKCDITRRIPPSSGLVEPSREVGRAGVGGYRQH